MPSSLIAFSTTSQDRNPPTTITGQPTAALTLRARSRLYASLSGLLILPRSAPFSPEAGVPVEISLASIPAPESFFAA